MNIKKIVGLAALAGSFFAAHAVIAQAPATAPAGSTGLCNDGTYFKGTMKMGACTGHKGLKTWYGAAAKTAATPAPAAAAAPAPAAAKAAPAIKATSSNTPQAPGGGPGMVWLNTASNVYHCPGTQYYGKTKAGSYMTESAALAKHAHPVSGKACTK